MSDSRPFITCHVLDTVAGKPGPGISVRLRLLSPLPSSGTSSHAPEAYVWKATTNADGRVTHWEPPAASSPSLPAVDLNAVVAQLKSQLHSRKDEAEDQMLFSLTFETEAYYGKGKTFWPQVELRFAAKSGEGHYHVPLLLGPWSYTTYRGS